MSKLKKYLIFTFAAAWAIGAVGCYDLINCGSMAGMMSFSYSLSFAMFMPAVGALIAGAGFKGMGWNPKAGKNWRLILAAWLIPTISQMIGAVFYYVMFPDDLDLSGNFFKEMDPYQFEQLEENGGSLIGYYLKESFLSLTSFQLCISLFAALGEEIGWRGYMFPELKERLGYTKGVLLGGVIHGAWHFPLMLLVGYEYGKDYIGAPLLGLFAFCVFTTSTGIISDFFYEKSGSIWLCGLYHAAGNSVFPVTILGANEKRIIFGPVDIGLIAVLPTVLFAAGIVYLRYRKERQVFDELE